ncbi:Uncharacterised protein g7139 [Pycnogonum litorale]
MKKTIVLMLLVLVLMAVAVNCETGKKLSNEELKAEVEKLASSNAQKHDGNFCYHGCSSTKDCHCYDHCCKLFYFGLKICVPRMRFRWIPCIPRRH